MFSTAPDYYRWIVLRLFTAINTLLPGFRDIGLEDNQVALGGAAVVHIAANLFKTLRDDRFHWIAFEAHLALNDNAQLFAITERLAYQQVGAALNKYIAGDHYLAAR
ncbi:MAG: hypothetical protein OXE78_01925 [Gammaproteobacteria bacterium]|nr:hypothetical protein [Gammaproteobacteria bacterium]MCY4358039.1 hypothetical protein [Gammaproteobacteria bacterium]